jgi:hypothetical protein
MPLSSAALFRDTSMKHLLPPEAWRSEGFAEDLFDDSRQRAPSPSPQRGALWATVLGVLPVALAMAGAALATFSHVA